MLVFLCLPVAAQTPYMVKNINPGSHSSNPNSLVQVGSLTFFVATDAAHGTELWKTDGTSGGTQLVNTFTLERRVHPRVR